jgi:hypothetical protein
MYRNRYVIQEIEETTTWTYDKDGDGIPDTTYDEGLPMPRDIQDAINALESNHWDSLDIRADEVLCYPADSHIDYRTGNSSRTTVIIKGNEYDIEWMMNLYFHREKERKRKENERRTKAKDHH